MYKKLVFVTRPWCVESFRVEIGDEYIAAKALPQGANSNNPEWAGRDKACPNLECQNQLFIHWLK